MSALLNFVLKHFHKSCKSRDRYSTIYRLPSTNFTTKIVIEFPATYRVHFRPALNPRGHFSIDGASRIAMNVPSTA